MITLTTFADAREALRHRALRQALYDEGHRLMSGVIVNLHGEEHIARRRLENRLFRRDTFAHYETGRIPAIIAAALERPVAIGHGDLLPIARRTMMVLAIEVAGVDLAAAPGTGPRGDAELDDLYATMDRLARASTVAHAAGDKAAVIADGDAALDEFEHRWFVPSLDRRQALVARWRAGELADTDLPRDVLTTLVRNEDRLELAPSTVLREVAYFPWVGSHSTSNQLVHAMHHVFDWIGWSASDTAVRRRRLVGDDVWRQRLVHESVRLHPASPVARRIATADVELKTGVRIADGDEVTIDIRAANRDPRVMGDRPDEFDPGRLRADGVAPWGLSFGSGVHACLGQELAGGLEVADAADPDHLFGAISVMCGALLAAGARPDPEQRPTADPTTVRDVWGCYPVVF